MSPCRGCRTETEEDFCDICDLLVHEITGRSGQLITPPSVIQSLRLELGDPAPRAPTIWRRISMVSENDSTLWWALDPQIMEPGSRIGDGPEPWMLSDEDFDLIGQWPSYMAHDVSPEESRQNQIRIRRLARGGTLPDGTHMSWNSGVFYVDEIALNVPYRSLNKVLQNVHKFPDIDWKMLLASIDLAVRKSSPDPYHNPSNSRFATVHPVFMMLQPDIATRHGNPLEALSGRFGPRKPSHIFQRLFSNATWMERWHANSSTREVVGIGDRLRGRTPIVPITLTVRNGRLQIRVRRNSGWRRIQLGSDPMVWLKVLTWALSPPDHPDFTRLMCLTQSLFADHESHLFSDQDIRGISFLRGIVESNSRAQLNKSENEIVVTGSSGLYYSVRSGGNYDTRFLVSPVNSSSGGMMRPTLHRRAAQGRDFICIVERPELRRLVLGDAIGSVVLSLLDDINSSKHIDTLRRHIGKHSSNGHPVNQQVREIPHPEVREMQEARMLRDRLANNRINQRIRRATRSFPTIWGVLLRLPLGERMTLTPMGGGPNIRFDGCDATFSTTNMADRQVISRMLEESGWIRDTEEGQLRGAHHIYIRTGTGERDLGPGVETFSRMLEHRLLIDGRNRAIPEPLWHHFERRNPGICALLPGSDQDIE
jgi:hypothetical protein